MALERQAVSLMLPPQLNNGYSDDPWTRMDEDAYYTYDQLRDRGWTGRWIKRFSADKIVRFAGSICFCRFWDRLKIQELECTPEWQDYRNATNAAAIATHDKDVPVIHTRRQ
jgi:hypothetical protein